MSIKRIKIVVIGGGAAGFFGAITCAQSHPDSEITILEASHEPLTKVRISGGGRCNVTHACFEPAELVQHYPRGGKALRGAFSRFQPRDMVAWLAAQGVELKTESDGRMFPVTDDSETIVNCLLKTAKNLGIELRTKVLVSSVQQISQEPSKFEVRLKNGEVVICDRLLLASGSNPTGYQIAQTLGHQIVTPVPSLFTFNIPDSRLRELAGVSVEKVKLRLQIAGKTHFEQTGAILITHWGLSGPAILKLSAWGARILQENHYQATLIINWVPDSNPEFLRKQLLAVRSQLPQRQISSTCPLLLPRRLWEYLIARVDISGEDRWAGLSNKMLNQLIQEITQGEYQIKGKGVFKEEFVTCGGVNLKEVNFKTMASKYSPGLYFAGEILDIDGVTGGFNFQSAWTTAWLAGQAMGN
ncbi:NAD(P)/FAD-dependent oxidoreductase [Aerosakkonemataceae cyanobacterium BLCC-F154]|uniref:NAD(P)/FAD-dependent oxidoreductase n=1 Tax=Floridaenema fluviatile BLCC-F154 TaxID=3153640 RepID=A0ABV4Y648_9CYAN